MRNRRTTNRSLAGKPGVQVPGGADGYVPTKPALFAVLKKLHYRRPPEIKTAQRELELARKAREDFERRCKKWRMLREAEMRLERRLRRISGRAQALWEKELEACWLDLQMHGVSPALAQRIERMVNGDGSEE